MNCNQELMLAVAGRAESLLNPIDGDFVREHNVSLDEPGELMDALSVAFAACAKSEDVDPDLRAQPILIGAAALSDVSDEMTPHALDLVRFEQPTARRSHSCGCWGTRPRCEPGRNADSRRSQGGTEATRA